MLERNWWKKIPSFSSFAYNDCRSYDSLQDTVYPHTDTNTDCYAVVVWRDDEIRAGRERVHTNELVKGDCPSTRKQSHRSRASIPRSPLTRRTRTPRVPVHVPQALLVCRYFGGGAWMCQLPPPRAASATSKLSNRRGSNDDAFATNIPRSETPRTMTRWLVKSSLRVMPLRVRYGLGWRLVVWRGWVGRFF